MDSTNTITTYQRLYQQTLNECELKISAVSHENVLKYLKEPSQHEERRRVVSLVAGGAAMGAYKGAQMGMAVGQPALGALGGGLAGGAAVYACCDTYIEYAHDPYARWKMQKKNELVNQEFPNKLEKQRVEELNCHVFFKDTIFIDAISEKAILDPVILRTEGRLYDRSTVTKHYEQKRQVREECLIWNPQRVEAPGWGGLDNKGNCPGIILPHTKFDMNTDLEPCYQTKVIIQKKIRTIIQQRIQTLNAQPQNIVIEMTMKFHTRKLKETNEIIRTAYDNALTEIDTLLQTDAIDGLTYVNLKKQFWDMCGKTADEDIFTNVSDEKQLARTAYAKSLPRPSPTAVKYISH